jgi:hypothetical protein
MSKGFIGGNKATGKGAAVFLYGQGDFEKTGGTIYGANAGADSNIAAEGATDPVYAIHMKDTLAAYYNDTAGPGVVLKFGSVKDGPWSDPPVE